MAKRVAAKRRRLGASLRSALPVIAAVAATLATTLATAQPADQAAEEPQVLAPGWSELEFEPPESGSYRLPVIGQAGDGRVIDSHRGETSLHALMGEGVVVLSFIYSSCSDANGCPLATHVLAKLKARLRKSPDGTAGVRFVSLSFDPVQDTPEVMRRYGDPFVDEYLDWRFLTTTGQAELAPILDRYGQAIVQDPGAEDGDARSISHVLRVYLIDPRLQIRNIYSASFLHADTMFNDIRTLQGELLAQAPAPASRQGPGDFREGYDTNGFQTRTQSLESRRGASISLMAYRDSAPLGLPPIPEPPENPITQEKAELGRLLFFDRRLSHNRTFSCAMCHVPEQGFTSNELATAVGIEGRTVRRNSPTIYNVAYLESLFLDGRETSLEQQIWGPLLAFNEMGNPSVGQVLETIRSIPDYVERFESAFHGRPPTMETVGMALASYERLLVSADSRFDRWHYGGQADAMSPDEQAGFGLFTGKAGCSACHLVGDDWAVFTDNGMHNTGVGYRRSMSKPPAESRVQIAPGEFVTVRREAIEEAAERPPNDLGLYEITSRPEDRWKYRTPSLRNVALTAPYMHDGSLVTLEEVVRFYDDGGVENPLLDPLVRPLGLDEAERSQLVAFLRALTGSNVDGIVADAFTVPVGNTGSSVRQAADIEHHDANEPHHHHAE
jgi:cytochrome c peroxidase